MHQDIVPLFDADIQEQLKKRFAYLSGGRGQDGSPVITFPDYPAFSEIPDKEFQNVLTYLTSIPRMLAILPSESVGPEDGPKEWLHCLTDTVVTVSSQHHLLIPLRGEEHIKEEKKRGKNSTIKPCSPKESKSLSQCVHVTSPQQQNDFPT
ncbi:uncharacterized protein isoform X2 [Castor canadensis]|uniref:Uncharacterized protein isoform X2 n=3 Tax=Castor canadensis TaxID=51338 RepID=A0AC58MZI5_CASCN